MKVSVNTWSFIRPIREGSIDLVGCVAKAKELGFDGIEIVEYEPIINEKYPEYLKKIRAEAERVGIKIVGYTFGADLLNGCDGDLDKEVERIKEHIDYAAILGAPVVRHDATFGFEPGKRGFDGFDTVLPRLADGCRRVTEYAATKGIRTCVENHGYFSQESLCVEKLVNAVANKNFGLLMDMGNFVCADDDFTLAAGRIAPYAIHAHAKDFHIKSGLMPNPGEGWFTTRGGRFVRGSIIGHGDVPILQSIRALHKAGYDGYLSVEFEGLEDPYTGIRIGGDNLKRFIKIVEAED